MDTQEPMEVERVREGALEVGGRTFRIRRAGPEDLVTLMEVMRDAARWLQARGLDQWAGVLEPEMEPHMLKRLREQEVYFACDGERAVATICLQWEDRDFWGEAGTDGLAGYVHGLAVVRDFGGIGLGARFLEWAGERFRARGRRLLRLDCALDNPGLVDYYLRQGFTDCGEKLIGKSFRVRQFEKGLG